MLYKRTSLSNLADYINGMAIKPSDWKDEGVKIIRIEQLNNPKGAYDYFQGYFPESNAIDNEDLIFSWSATLKVVIWKYGKGVLNQHLFKVIPYTNTDKYFLHQLLDYHMDKLAESSHGSTMKHIKREELDKYKVVVPADKQEQQRIANILSTCDKVIDKTEETIEKYKQIKAGMMQDLFTRGLDENGKLRPTYTQAPDLYKYSKELDRYIPKEWNADKLDNLFTYTVGGDVDRPCFSEYQTSLHKYPIFANAVDNEGLYGYSSKFVINCPAITIAGRGNVGTVFYRDAFFTPIVRLIVAFPNECLNILFASIALSRIKFESEATGIPQLTVPMVKKYKMAYPKNKEEQQNIYKYLHKIDLKLDKEEQYLNKYKQIKQGLMKQLLTPPADAEIVEE